MIVQVAVAAAAIETETVLHGVWWSISLVTTTGSIGAPPRTDAGAALSVFLMVVGYLLLALVSASFAAVFVRDEERPRDAREELAENAIVASLTSLEARLTSLESQLNDRAARAVPFPVGEADPPSGTQSMQ